MGIWNQENRLNENCLKEYEKDEKDKSKGWQQIQKDSHVTRVEPGKQFYSITFETEFVSHMIVQIAHSPKRIYVILKL